MHRTLLLTLFCTITWWFAIRLWAVVVQAVLPNLHHFLLIQIKCWMHSLVNAISSSLQSICLLQFFDSSEMATALQPKRVGLYSLSTLWFASVLDQIWPCIHIHSSEFFKFCFYCGSQPRRAWIQNHIQIQIVFYYITNHIRQHGQYDIIWICNHVMRMQNVKQGRQRKRSY